MDLFSQDSSSSSLEGGAYGLLERRAALRRDIRQVCYITLNDFVDTVLPQSYKSRFSDLDNITQHLQEGSEPALDDRGHWSAFLDLPNESKNAEIKVFESLEDIVSAISSAVDALSPASKEEDTRHVEYMNNGNRVPESSHRDNTSRPDGFFVRKERPPPPPPSPAQGKQAKLPVARWWDIAVIAEFKKALTKPGFYDDVDKMLWGFHHILCEDPCRNFVYGFTIERTSAKLWYCDRSNVVVSDVFDLHKDSSIFLKFCISLLCASREELGWDSTIERVESPGADAHYIIDVRVVDSDSVTVRRFVTTSIISASGAECILGRGTRVWEAREKLEDGTLGSETVALKDYWIDDDRPREGQVQHYIINGAPAGYGGKVEKYLVKIECHGDVFYQKSVVVSREGTFEIAGDIVPTSTRDLNSAIKRRNRALVLDEPFLDAYKTPTHDSRAASGTPTPVTPSAYHNARGRAPLALVFGVKTKNRIVMAPVGESLHKQTSLRTIFKALLDVCNGMKLVHLSGWVHRDISPGNIIVHKGRGYLTDFEYAKRVPPEGQSWTTSHAERMGTPYFMAVEVQFGGYLFLPNRVDVPVYEEDDFNEVMPDPKHLPIQESLASSPVTEYPSSPSPSPSCIAFANPSASPSSPPAEPSLFPSSAVSSARSSPSPERTASGPRPGNKRKRARKLTAADGAEPDELPATLIDSIPPKLSPPPRTGFSYNPLHDYESLVWICLYFIVNRVVVGHTRTQLLSNLVVQRRHACDIFSGYWEPRQFLYTTLDPGLQYVLIDQIIDSLHPAVRGIGQEIKKMFKRLKAAYSRVEAQDLAAIARSNIALSFRRSIAECLERIIKILEEEDLQCAPIPVIVEGEPQPEPIGADGGPPPPTMVIDDEGSDSMVQAVEESSQPAAKKARTEDS